MATATTSTIIALFDSRTRAEQAVSALISEGYSREQISIVSSDPRRDATPDIGPREEVGSGSDAGAGAAIGGLAGFLGGIIALAIPGIGPILAVGPLAAGIMGAGIGAATGGVIGALKSHGVSEEDASRISEAIRRGRVLVSAQVPQERVDHAADVLDKHGALDVDEPEERVDLNPEPASGDIRPLPPQRVRTSSDLTGRQKERERRVWVYPGITGGGSLPSA